MTGNFLRGARFAASASTFSTFVLSFTILAGGEDVAAESPVSCSSSFLAKSARQPSSAAHASIIAARTGVDGI